MWVITNYLSSCLDLVKHFARSKIDWNMDKHSDIFHLSLKYVIVRKVRKNQGKMKIIFVESVISYCRWPSPPLNSL